VARQIGSGGERPETWLARLAESVTVGYGMRVEISLDAVATSAALDASTYTMLMSPSSFVSDWARARGM
jgi:hypothetical protein